MKIYLLLFAMLISTAAMAEDTCPEIAKLCPDGSSVSPQGPKCKMAACPDGGDKQLQTFTKEEKPEDDCTGDDCVDDK